MNNDTKYNNDEKLFHRRDILATYRHNKQYLTLRLTQRDYEKLKLLCADFSIGDISRKKRIGISTRAIIVKLIMNEHITSQIDDKAYRLFCMHIGLHKHASNVFPIKLPIDDNINLLNKAQDIILTKSYDIERLVNKIDKEYDSKSHKFKQTGIYLTNEQMDVLSKKAKGESVSKAEYIRRLINKKQITSRFLASDIIYIDKIGVEIKSAIDYEIDRQQNNVSAPCADDILFVLQTYKEAMNRILFDWQAVK